MKKDYFKMFLPLVLLFGSSLYASSSGKELFMQKCSMCHKTSRPKDTSSLVAPPISGVAMHVKMNYPSKEEAVEFISEYALNPQRSKAVCMPQRIKRFGLMPSQKGAVTKEELQKIASYIYDNYPKKGFRGMLMQQDKHGVKNMQKQGVMGSKKGKKVKPFLIKKGLPHLTKMVAKNWDNPALNLTKEQKKRLLVVKKETLKSVKDLMGLVNMLRGKIISKTLNGENPKSLKIYVDMLSKAEAEATMVHLKCIYDTKNILTNKQYEYLLNMFKNRKNMKKRSQ